MARRKTPATARPPAARSAAHSAPAPAPAPSTGPAPGSPTAAIHAALTAHPGATTAILASAAGIGGPAARDALTAMETAGTVTRTKGGKPGIPDTWTLTAPGPATGQPAPGQANEHALQPDAPAASDTDGTGQDAAADGTPYDDTSTSVSARQRDDDAPASADSAADPPAQPGTGPAGDKPDGSGEEEPVGEAAAVRDSTHDDGTGPGPSDGTATDGAPAPALVAEITGKVEQIQAAATAAKAALAGGADLNAVRAGMDEIWEQATQARQALKTAAGGRKAPAARPGALRDKVLAHLRDHPGTEFTPHEIHKVLGNSSGAITNALDTLVKHGQAELASDKPRRFRLAPGAPAAAQTGTPSGTGLDDGTNGDAELAGAA